MLCCRVCACTGVQVKDDPEWARFSQIPGLTDTWNDVRDKLGVAAEEFKVGARVVHGGRGCLAVAVW